MRPDKVPNEALLDCGLDLMRQATQPLSRLLTKGRSMLYEMENGNTVRVRTGNDHLLISVASGPDPEDEINIEGTDWLLIVMPEEPRTYGPVVAYLVPTEVAVRTVRKAHKDWLASNPNTKGSNTTRNIWFGPHSKSGGFAHHWREYRLEGEASTAYSPDPIEPSAKSSLSHTLGSAIAEARHKISEVAGVPPDAVKISVDLT